MGWIKEEVKSTDEIFNDIISNRKEWRGIPDDSTTPYEYFVDYIRDYYDVTLKQCSELCKRLKEYYNIKNFYFSRA